MNSPNAPRFIRRATLAALLLAYTQSAPAQYDLSWNTIDGGGVMFSTGGSYALGGTIGQPDASSLIQPMYGGTWQLVGGFWAVANAAGPLILGDLDCDGSINNFDVDAFLLALTNPAAYEMAYPDCDISAADINGDSSINNFDVDPFVACLLAGGCS